MKLAQIVCTFPPYKGGIGNSAYHFAQILKTKGIQVTTFTPNYKKRETTQEYINNGIKTTRVNPWLKYGNGAIIPGLYPQLKDHDRILLHYPFFGGSEIVWLFKLWTGKDIPLIIHYHMDVEGLNFTAKLLSLPSNLIFNSLFLKADRITCASLDYIKNSKINKFYRKYPEQFTEIPFGVDTNKFRPGNKKTSSKIRLLFVGGLDQAHCFKGLAILLKAMAILENDPQTPDWELNIVGEGELRPSYEEQAQKLGVKKRVNFRGALGNSDLVGTYQKSDVFILPSINKGEAFGLVLLEAMACGIPVIASDLPGVRNVFENNKQGLLATPGDEKDLANKLKALLLDEEKKNKMGREAIALIKAKYSWEKVGDKLEKVIKKIR